MDKNNVKNNTEVRRLYGVALVGTVKEKWGATSKKDPTSVVHSALLLPILARLKNPYVNEYHHHAHRRQQDARCGQLYALKAAQRDDAD